ncbi:MAG: hypothetical protein HY898_18875 [Deltaproteobacteria bacterium]|nr:hypothetical protein [Deltaproteobacteria bacterium]
MRSIALRCTSLLLAVASVAWGPADAWSQMPSAQVCVEAHRDAQQLRRTMKLLAARDKLIACAGASCPGLVQQDCANWLNEVQQSIPSAVVSARDPDGHEVAQVRVSIDGRAVIDRLDGRPMELDPGAYRFRYEHEGSVPIEADVVMQTGVKNRVLQVVFKRPQQTARNGRRTAGWVLAGTGAAALVSFGVFAALGESQYRDLKDRCAPRCDSSESDSVRRNFLIADISLGVSAVTLAAGTWLLLGSSSQTPPQRATIAPGLQVVHKGAVAAFGGEF